MKTPQLPAPRLAQALALTTELYLKREDLHHLGSHKGRSIPFMIKEYHKQGVDHFVISSSGNAALAAIYTVSQHNENKPNDPLRLSVFVGTQIPPEKLASLTIAQENENSSEPMITLQQVPNPKQAAFQLASAGPAKLLRQSTDDLALAGYAELAEELKKIPNLAAVFIPTSSGTTAQALGEAFGKFGKKIEIHIVQTAACHPIAEKINSSPRRGGGGGVAIESRDQASNHNPPSVPPTRGERNFKPSIATAIVDHVAHRKDAVIDAIKKSGGSGWIVTDDEIRDAMRLAKEACEIMISPNSALSIAAVKKAIESGWRWTGPVACLITGR